MEHGVVTFNDGREDLIILSEDDFIRMERVYAAEIDQSPDHVSMETIDSVLMNWMPDSRIYKIAAELRRIRTVEAQALTNVSSVDAESSRFMDLIEMWKRKSNTYADMDGRERSGAVCHGVAVGTDACIADLLKVLKEVDSHAS